MAVCRSEKKDTRKTSQAEIEVKINKVKNAG